MVPWCDNRAAPNQGTRGTRNPLATDKELSDFLKSVEKRAFKRTAYAVRDDDAALDIVQDAMIRLAEKYADRPAAELPLMFQRILSNATMDWFRRQKVRKAPVQNFSDFESGSEDGDFDLLEALEAVDGSWASQGPPDRCRGQQTLGSSTPRWPHCRRVNAKPSCCVTGKNWILPKPRW